MKTKILTLFSLLVPLLVNTAGAATVEVTVTNDVFTPEDIVIQKGDTVRWTNQEGTHNVVAQDNSFLASGAPLGPGWVHEVTFTEAAVHIYRCEPHSSTNFLFGMVGSVTVGDGGGDDDDDDDDDGFLVNFGITGSWANLATLGQGWLFEILPALDPPLMVAYNFTYPPLLVQKGDPEFFGNQMWLVGAAEIVGNTVTVMADRPIAGAFDDPLPPFFPDESYATFIFTFFDCFNAMVSYDIPSKNLTGEYLIERITPDVLCEELAAQP